LRNSIARLAFSKQALWIAILLAMLAGVAGVPLRMAAQQSGMADQPNAALDKKGAKVEGSKSEQEELDKFRHTPMVISAAKALHLSVETTARSFEFINFGVIFLAIAIPLFRWLPKFLKNRAAKVRDDIESAKKVTEDANSRLSAVEAKLASIGEEIAKFRAEVERESSQDEVRIKSTIEEESTRIVAAAEQEIGVAAAQARRTLRHFAADLAIDQAARQLVLTPETDRALIAEFVGDIAKGGLN
jgi:F-type H+-transporting ATPase subunit b